MGLNIGSAFAAEVVWTSDVWYDLSIGDFNGDGLPDVIEKTQYVRLNNGIGLDPQIDWGSSATIKPGSYWSYYVEFFDYNADGLMDRKTTNSTGAWIVQLNTGDAFVEVGVGGLAYQIDLNRDGFKDNLTHSVHVITRNPRRYKGELSVVHGDSTVGSSQTATILQPLDYGFDKYSGFGDINGDGLLDPSVKETYVCKRNYALTNYYLYYHYCETERSRVFVNDADRPNLVSSITESSGREIQFEYDWLASGTDTYTKGTGAELPEFDIQDSTRVVKNMRISNGIGGDFETTYKYEGLKWGLDGRGILGFAKIISTNLDTNIETTTEYEQSFPLVMQPKHVEQRRVSDGRLLAETDTTYAINGTVGAGPVFGYAQTTVEKKYALGDGRLLVTQTTDRTVDAYGNTTTLEVETDDTENTEIRQQVVANAFNVDVTQWRVGELASNSTTFWLNGGSSSRDTRTTTYSYGTTYGLLKTTTREPGGGAGIEVTTTRTHDAFGNVLSETIAGPGFASRTTSIAYDTRGQFPTTLTNALGHVVSQSWLPEFGKKTSQTDANGQTTTWSYDSFGQQTLETRPDGTSVSTLTYKDPTGSGVSAAFYQETLESGKAPRRTFVDLLGRTVRERSQSFDGSYVNVDSEYDALGRLSRQSEPHFDGGGVDWNTFGYDDIGRVTSLIAADSVASTTTVYNGLTTTVTDAAGRSETQSTDAAGRVISVIDKDGTSMGIAYDAAGNRSSVTAAAGTAVASVVNYSYDRYGRMTQQDDPDHGVYSYSYDALGNKLTEISPEMAAAAQSRTFIYDLLSRVTSRTEPEGTAVWTYDHTALGDLGIGKVHSESQSGFSREYTYGAGHFGRVTGISTTIGTSTYTETKTYDGNGMLASEKYPASLASPSGYTVEYAYNALGYLERVQSLGGTQVFYQTLDTNAAGRVTQEWLGDGSTVTQSFDGVSARVTSQLSQATSTIQQFSYSYDSAGNMLTRDDNLQSLSEAFTYDDLDRLTSAQVVGQTAVSYAFDAMGSITQKTDVADTYDYIAGPAHAVTLLTQGANVRSLSYDANGNFALGTNEPTMVWSSYNKPTQLAKSGITYDFLYGPDRRRFQKQRNTETTHYVGSRFERRFGGSAEVSRSVIYANGRAIMVREDSAGGTTHRYLHRDHLGSVTAITDESTGNVLDRLSYDAWGLRRIATTWAAGSVTATDHRGYTGHEHLDDIGIIHMNGRIYEPTLGRMLSPDPVTQAPNNGQVSGLILYRKLRL
nr:Rhs family protein [Congregibacter litoralis]